MTHSLTKSASRFDGLEWTPLRKIETEKGCYVEYYVRNPLTNQMVRKRKKFNCIGAGRSRDMAVQEYIRNTEAKLLNGWNPFADDGKEIKVAALIKDVRVEYEEALVFEGKRSKTIVDYRNRLKHFCDWCAGKRLKHIGECTPARVEEYLNYKVKVKGVGACARNNERTLLSAFFTWCVGRFYLADNPCKGIKTMRVPPKRRRILTGDEVARVAEYFLENDKYMLLAVMFQYYTLIRPNELMHLRVGDVHMEEQYVVVPAEYSKNHREQPVALNDRLVAFMKELGIDKCPKEAWLFGYGCKPCFVPGNHAQFRYRWWNMREELGLPREVQFYSLKDTGIIDLINAEGVLLARDQARHSSIAVTNLYAQYGGNTAHEATKHFNGKF